ncbi:glycosyl hydrolase family 18 protein [Cohnella fermenti]|uniref:Glycosyl hydrolase n=1 Tax=Cohnella fermenti TaxID=2565925 RepID=A0A4S4C818_9BACL|nr:glycosyl hydrolase family 18 protein [Cohnella fermenti]THF84143.1 glycosyl hydrolase [Cohnella fermenti]
MRRAGGGSRSGRRNAYGLVALAAAVLVGAGVAAWLLLRGEEDEARRSDSRAAAKTELSAWLADWQWEAGLSDLDRSVAGLDSLQAFAAYFDESDRLLFTDDFEAGFPAIRERLEQEDRDNGGEYGEGGGGAPRLDLTLVNDIVRADGSESQKDPELVTRLLADDASRSAHIGEIMAAVERYGVGGVELDYERVDDGDWERMLLLIDELYAKLVERGKSLRIVLEPRAPIEKLSWPEGPEYVLMAYNLYGSHSEPGPKADLAFIREQAKRMAKLPGARHLALASGGFDWLLSGPDAGKATGITEAEAAELAERSLDQPTRDEASGSLRFEYTGEDGAKHEVWYADGETLAGWAAAARSSGANLAGIALWRLGGLGDASLEGIASGLGE